LRGEDDPPIRIESGARHLQELVVQLDLTRWRIADRFRDRGQLPGGPPPDPGSPATTTGTSTVERVPGPDHLNAEWEIEWKRKLLETALARVGRRVKAKHLQIFDLYALRRWPASQVARELGVTRVQVYLVYHRPTKLMKREVAYLARNLE
jgi:hypothetical protein